MKTAFEYPQHGGGKIWAFKYSLPKPGLQLKLAAEAETVGFCCLNEVILLYRRAEEEKP